MIKREELEMAQLKAKTEAALWRDGEVSSLVEEHERTIDNHFRFMESEHVVHMSQIKSEDASIRADVLEKIKALYASGGWNVSSEKRKVNDPSKQNHMEPCVVIRKWQDSLVPK